MDTNSVQHKPQTGKLLQIFMEFFSSGQRRAIVELSRGEEGGFFRAKLAEYLERIDKMPVTYEQEGKGVQTVAHLHYFLGGWDWYITEKDVNHDGTGQRQAFGLVGNQYGRELGYIDLAEILRCGAELDLHFEPKTLEALGFKLG